jgi:aarF domain-containing kinase
VYQKNLEGLEKNTDEYNFALEKSHDEGSEILLSLITENSGLYIKLGQLIGQMVHLVPDQYIQKLKVLFDKAPKRDFESVRRTFQEELGEPPEKLFWNFNPEPIASASLAQVYVGHEKETGAKLAIKVQHRELMDTVQADFIVLDLLIRALHFQFPDVDYTWFIREAKRGITEELDFQMEAENCKKCKKLFQHRKEVIIPEVYDKYSSDKILTMEFIEGIPLYEIEKLKQEKKKNKQKNKKTKKGLTCYATTNTYRHTEPISHLPPLT